MTNAPLKVRNLGEKNRIRTAKWGVLSKDLVALSLMTSASTSLIGESKAGLHLEKVGVVEGRCFQQVGSQVH